MIVSVHCHDDLGLATANTLAGIAAGARQAEVTINGIGERAGNTSLEEVVMALHTRRPVYELDAGIDTTQIMRLSRMVSNVTGMAVQPNKAIVGANAFAHEAGIHQDGMLKHEGTYEIMRPETVGLHKSELVLGKHSGRHAFKVRLAELGYDVDQDELNEAFRRFKDLADKKKTITDADLVALMTDQLYQPREIFQLEGLQVACGTMGLPTATVRLVGPDGAVHVHAAVGTGPVDACYKAIDDIIQAPNTLLEFSIRAVTEGIDAIGEVTVRLQAENGATQTRTSPQSGAEVRRTFGGHAADTDIIVASAKAYLSAVNRLLIATGRYASRRCARRPNRNPPNTMTQPQTLFAKVWANHVVASEAGSPTVLYIDLHLVHEVTSPQAFNGLRQKGLTVRRADRTVATMDHSIPTRGLDLPLSDAIAARQLAQLATNCGDFGITLHDMDSPTRGIVHVIGPELGLTQPGMTIVCGDSHTSTHGAFGALAFGIGTSEVEHVLATQCLLQYRPQTFRVNFDGALAPRRDGQGHDPGPDRRNRRRRRHRPCL